MYASRNRLFQLTKQTFHKTSTKDQRRVIRNNNLKKAEKPKTAYPINIFQNISDEELHQKPDQKSTSSPLPRHEDLTPPPTLTPEMTTNPAFSVKQQFPTPTFDKTKITTNAADLTKFNHLPEPVYNNPVLPLSQVITILENMAARDISVIRVDPRKGYVDYFVTCIGMTRRHLTTVGQKIITTYKTQWDPKTDFVPVGEGLRTKSDWVCVNIGNCVVHVMTEYSRTNLCLEELQALDTFDPYQEIPDDIIDAQAKADERYFQKAQNNEDGMMDDLAKEFLAEDDREQFVRSVGSRGKVGEGSGFDDVVDAGMDDNFFSESLSSDGRLTKSLINEDENEDLAAFESFLREQELEAEKFLGGGNKFKM